ncbi:MAG: hypothetical protein A3C43_07620 [Candidatus Schekmanbacteria bacterium RIFCSPHIGHO2_02_FULL_38_11]|uniref:Amidinotransferase n=1 Tax=Candidatus Schekmanbacteria bacterium RIFCSPLOWO2_12_FULL_38_15 TaxID=1817883 RepID=A0A1F7SGB0_9BACT|nr:MAG: hypothetical protein A2043_11240 [Candidatus Schekmanbacteria bacterium GWA2_38_9]OGL48904.1 MAG: hypothetical protein A3C43_07620 [Candidatus Schekmanbacteria bacterium RIFCSPHIGHO2_02_FULL_38_11]OGL49865.1 MAG: hypothetical protein A3H37_09660 [Candidatus Schekmanbacteria bacterium RIFCSPLOWO2_02_FULL_38_14]OGL52795.1 MAG: hypothetical protein A3G31_00140 [Candidatus Schekmanbacteria bacterium RIFCSPLOWO2_12_FULL_38_15]
MIKKSILMCPPDYYGIRYEINPWMDVKKDSDKKLSRKQWEDLYNLINRKIGIEIKLIEPQKNYPDMVFTANAGFVFNNTFIKSNFRFKQRKGESGFFEKWFKKNGYRIEELPEETNFEGEGDLLLCGENFYAGYIIRSDINAHTRISKIINKRILSLELVNQKFYHLDTCFLPLSNGEIAYYPYAFDLFGRKIIKNYIKKSIAVKKTEALKFGCNAICIGRDVVLNSGCDGLKNKLLKLKYRVFETNLSEFIKAGGSAKCLVLFI